MRRDWWRCWGLAGLGLAGVGCNSGETLEPGTVVIENVHVISMEGPMVLERASVIVQGERIQRVATTRDFELRGDTRLIDGGGGYLLPGLIDPHVHIRRPEELGLYVAAGVTTVRNMNGNFGDPLEWREQVASGTLFGPRLVTSSPTLFDQSPDYAWHVDGPDRARQLARQFQTDGYDLIKVYHLTEPTFLALAAEARALGIPVAGHYPTPETDLGTILDAGMTSIEHLDELVVPAFQGRSDYARIPDVVGEIQASGVAIGTILSQWEAYNHGLDDPNALLTDSLLTTATRYFGEAGEEELRRTAKDITSRDRESIDRDRSDFGFLFALLLALDEAGVPILASTDAHQALAPAGEALINELGVMERAGMSPYSILRAATVSPAVVMGLDTEHGTVSPGKVADLLLVADNPLEHLATLRRPIGVMLRGEWLNESRLDDLRAGSLAATR